MRFLVGLVIGAIIAAAIGAGAIAVALGEIDDVDIANRDKSADVSRTFELTDFDRIEVAGVYELKVAVGSDFSVEISGPEKEMARVEARVDDGVLILDQRKHERGRIHRDGVSATVTLPALSALDISGVVDGEVSGVVADDFDIDLSGVGDLEVAGECAALTAHVSGVGDLDAENFKCKTVKVTVSGVGDASVYASEAVEARISGIGDINVHGSPARVDKHGGMFSHIEVD